MKRILLLVMTAFLVLQMPFAAMAADEQTIEQSNAAIAEKAAELEGKYGVGIVYKTNNNGQATITMNSLDTLDRALENVTPVVVKQVSSYYKKVNGQRITFSYVRSSSNLTGSAEAVLAGFDNTTSLIELYIPGSSADVIATGENPISIVHEFGHAFHFMCADLYGSAKLKTDWMQFNGKIDYHPLNIQENPNSRVFVTGYAATMYEEDVAETFAHAFVRNQAGLGFKNKLSTDGKQTALGKKVAFVENLIATYVNEPEQALENYRQIYTTATAINYQGMRFSGDYLQYMGYPQPRYILSGTLSSLEKNKDQAIWLRVIGGWYVREKNGNEIIIFPGGSWCEVSSEFKAPKAA